MPVRSVLLSILALVLSGLLAVPAGADRSEPRTSETERLGFIEDVYVGKLRLEMKGKLDTGADSSSVYARDVEIYKKSKRDNWVRFRLVGKDGRTIRYDQNVIRFALIKLKKGGTVRRPVIHLPICVGGVQGLAEVNLANREEFDYDFLVGREFLASRVVVDAGQTFIAEESCESDESD